jgi:glycosidase
MKLAYTLLATVRGIPQLFYGDEMMFATGKGYKSDGELRMDFPGGWQGDEKDLFTEEGRQGTDAELYEYARKLFRWRKDNDVIHDGRTMHFLTRDNTYAFFRYNDSGKVFVYINNSLDEKTIPWSHYAEIASGLGEGTNVLTGEMVTVTDSTVVGPCSALVVDYR